MTPDDWVRHHQAEVICSLGDNLWRRIYLFFDPIFDAKLSAEGVAGYLRARAAAVGADVLERNDRWGIGLRQTTGLILQQVEPTEREDVWRSIEVGLLLITGGGNHGRH